MMNGSVLIAGMFRSGTTLLSSLLSDHPQCMVISDPFVYFFKLYRDFHLKALGLTDWQPAEPTPDYFGGARRDLFERLMAADMSESLPAGALEELIVEIRAWKTHQHPELCARLDEIRPSTFAETYAELMALAVDVYGKAEVEVAGTKVSWCEEFLPAMARAFPEMRFVLPVRDLRAVVASQNNQTNEGAGRRPLLFYVRHWRKSVALAQHYATTHPLMRKRVTIVRYEDLVHSPDEVLPPILRHVNLSARDLQLSDGANGSSPNSSFTKDVGSIFTGSAERWRGILSVDEISAIEALAGPELTLLGYDVSGPVLRPMQCLELDCEPPFESISTWLKPFSAASYLRDPVARRSEYLLEERRREVLEGSSVPSAQDESELFLVPGFMARLRQAWRP